MIPAPLPWLRSHPWPAAVVVALLVGIAIGWAAHPRPPVIDLHRHDQVQTQATQHQVAAQQVQLQATVAAKVEKHEAKQRHVHTRRTEVIAPDGTRRITTDRIVDEGEQLELAQQLDLHSTAATSLQLDLTSAVAQVATLDLELHQEPAPAPSWTAQAKGGLTSAHGAVYGGELTWRPIGPLVVSGELLLGGEVVAVAGAGFTW